MISLLLLAAMPAADLRIDLNPDNGRGDVKAPQWEAWAIPAAGPISKTVNGLTFTFTSPNPLKADWWKAGFDYPAAMASDGLIADRELTLTIAGLSKGTHSLAAYHNLLSNEMKSAAVTMTIQGQSSTNTPSKMVTHDDLASSNWLTFEAEGLVTVSFKSQGLIVVNGLEIDRPNAMIRARKPSPYDDDEHAVERPVLTWLAAQGDVKQRVYLGDSSESLKLIAEVRDSKFDTSALKFDPEKKTFWRVDLVNQKEEVTPGVVWSFRTRQLAFPTAEGAGRFARGGRGGKVFTVTNLNDSGPGSLREAVEATGPRTVVFAVGGLIELKSKLVVRNPYLTIAGQTAPGDGICLKNYTVGCSDTHDVIIRHLRIRVGDESGTTQDGSGARGCDHVIYDHCSISWSIDEGFSSRQAKNLTVQRCLIAEALNIANHKKYQAGKGHSFAGSISGGVGSFHHNLLAHCTGRNWSLAGGLDRSAQKLAGQLDLRNNVIYNWRDRTTDGGVLQLNFVNNLYLPGPATKTFTLLKPDPGDHLRGMRAYMAGNEIEGKDVADNWAAFVGSAEMKEMVKQSQPFFEADVVTQSPKDAYDSVITDVGATKPKSDAVDTRIIEDVKKRSHTFTGSKGQLPGIIDTPSDAGGYPVYRTGPAPSDRDGDGIPDDVETMYGLDPANPKDAHRIGIDGFTMLENYLNFMAGDRPSLDPKYRQTIRKRATAAVESAKVTDGKDKAIAIVEQHYFEIQNIHADRDGAVKAANKDQTKIDAIRKSAREKVDRVQANFLIGLKAIVTPEQTDAIQDAITYGVRNSTFKAYTEMLPNLKDDEKAMIRKHLLEARNEAVIAGDANEKHEKFRIAKGRINNELSKNGYDLKKAGEDWAARRKQDQAKPPVKP